MVSWNIIEFIYSSILTILCGISFWLAFGYASHVPPGGHSSGYVFTGIFMVLQTAFYGIPTVLAYDSIRIAEAAEEASRQSHPFTDPEQEETRYQTQAKPGAQNVV